MVNTPKLPPIDSFIPTKADMSHCPLCLGKFTVVEETEKTGKVFLACFKPKCMISIWIRDPMVGRWFRVESEKCAMCNTMTRLFFRSDEYIKMQCPKCFWTIENVDDAKHAAMMKKEESEGKRKTYRGLTEQDPA